MMLKIINKCKKVKEIKKKNQDYTVVFNLSYVKYIIYKIL
jgi:hypothetical protein